MFFVLLLLSNTYTHWFLVHIYSDVFRMRRGERGVKKEHWEKWVKEYILFELEHSAYRFLGRENYVLFSVEKNGQFTIQKYFYLI